MTTPNGGPGEMTMSEDTAEKITGIVYWGIAGLLVCGIIWLLNNGAVL